MEAPPTSRGEGWRKRQRDVTTGIVAALEGAFVLARTLRDTEPLLAAGRVLAAQFRGVHLLPRVVAEDVGSAR